jgi:hypothetical protein
MALILLKTPNVYLTYILFPIPYLMLLGIWMGFKRVNVALELLEKESGGGDSKPVNSLKERIGIIATYGIAGTAISLAIGWQLGHLAVR